MALRRESDSRHGPVEGSAWTFETLDLHLDLSVERVKELLDQYRASHADLHSLEHNQLTATADQLSKRLDDMNAWRAQLAVERSDYVGKSEFNAHVNGQAARFQEMITQLQQDVVRLTGTGTVTEGNLKIVGAAVDKLEDRVNAQLPREIYEDQHNRLQNRVDSLEQWKATVAGRTIAIVGLMTLLSGTLGVILGHVLFR